MRAWSQSIPKCVRGQSFSRAPNWVVPEWIEQDSSAKHPSTTLPTLFPNKKVLIMTLCQSIESVARLPYLHPAPFYLPSPPLSVVTGRSGGSGAAELVRAPPEGVDCLERLVRSQYLTPFSPSLHLLLLHKPQRESRGTLISDQEMYWSLSMSSHRGRGGARGALKAWQSWVCACAREP